MSTSSDVLTPIGIIDAPASDGEAQASHAEELNVVSRETAGEILAPGGTEEQQLVNLPAPMTNKLFAPAGLQMSTTLNSDNATEQQAGWPPKDAVAASSLIEKDRMEHKADPKPLNRSPISMMNRPRGVSLDQVINTDQLSRTAIRSLQAPLPIQSTSQKTPGIEEQGRQPSFKTLPPIRRTSKFGFEFGSRKPQTRFPISDDDDDDVSNGYMQDVANSNTMVGTSDPTSQQNARTDVSIVNKAPVSKPNVHTNTQPRFSVFPRVADPFVHKNHGHDVERSNPAMGHTRQNSWNSLSKISRSRRGSVSDQRRDSNVPPPMIPALPFESPPSSTQRYPELFGGPAIEVQDDHNMPGGYYQAPRGRTEALPPRQPSSEISGARPSQNNEEPVGHRRRRSSDLVSRGMNFVRSLSRERRGSVSRERKGSISRDGEIPPMDTFATPTSRDGRQKKRGSGFWGNFDITGEQSSDFPVGRESMMAHYSGSQSNLMASPRESPMTPKSPNPNPTLETPNSNIVGRSTTTMGKTLQRDDKRGRLAGLSGLFSRSPKGDGSVLFKPKRATTDLSSFSPRGGTLSSPQLEAQTRQDANVHHKRRPSQPLNFLSKFAPSPSLQKTENPSQDSKLYQEPRPRRPSVSGLLTGMLRKRSNTLEKDNAKSEDDGRRPMIVPVARMYTDLAMESHEALPDPVATPTQRLKKTDQERGRTRNSTRSPAREHPGQQRPFQLALPYGSNGNSRSSRSSTPPIPPPNDGAVAAWGQTSVLLPADEILPTNENIDIDRFPLPPSPQNNPEWHRNRNLSASSDNGLQRTSTGRSLVSAVSQISDSPSPQPQAEHAMEHFLHVEADNHVKRQSGGSYNASTKSAREDVNMAEKYAERKDDKQIERSGSNRIGDTAEREIGEMAGNKGATYKNAHTREERLQMSATSYPERGWKVEGMVEGGRWKEWWKVGGMARILFSYFFLDLLLYGLRYNIILQAFISLSSRRHDCDREGDGDGAKEMFSLVWFDNILKIKMLEENYSGFGVDDEGWICVILSAKFQIFSFLKKRENAG
ncbi:predicted protein [Sclerotinia sclerotiorum 1980 UF-70]|uniref:Uncharacterized protein n=1 Tax=Sclerotinia sclerotiorum (strain ATCC 18683 / 1980 / Ss-1) TaxID=665079 RepID=A7EVH4_SCLS1|nr:predicted protein [Sclerotinia sclerotiorum 1980 UF-70]EDN93466.1 predicted protein [Sclerotinia sclerotiorum 1980 UF-70]